MKKRDNEEGKNWDKKMKTHRHTHRKTLGTGKTKSSVFGKSSGVIP
jgi:hypothetical protein